MSDCDRNKKVKKLVGSLQLLLGSMRTKEKIKALNWVRRELHEISPFVEEPVDLVQWVPCDKVVANDYNPNAVAPPEMALLATSILSDGYTQPIVTYPHDAISEVIDGFHRNRVGRENKEVRKRVMSYLPVVKIKQTQESRNDRIASTIRHNRARGKHVVDSMSDIVVELKKRNWTDNRICKELGMDQDEVLRLCQISGLTEVFADADFSQAWDAAIFTDEEIESVNEEDVVSQNKNGDAVSDDRILHQWDKWECYPAGLYEDKPPEGMTVEDCEVAYCDFLSDIPRFDKALKDVSNNWKNSCEHYLTNEQMNRIAWLGQASMCFDTGISARFRGGFNLLTPEQQLAADEKALEHLNKWLSSHGRETLDMDGAKSKTVNNLY